MLFVEHSFSSSHPLPSAAFSRAFRSAISFPKITRACSEAATTFPRFPPPVLRKSSKTDKPTYLNQFRSSEFSEIPTVHIYHLAKPQPMERVCRNSMERRPIVDDNGRPPPSLFLYLFCEAGLTQYTYDGYIGIEAHAGIGVATSGGWLCDTIGHECDVRPDGLTGAVHLSNRNAGIPSEVGAGRCYGHSVYYEWNSQVQTFVICAWSRSANSAKLPSEGLRLNVSSPSAKRLPGSFSSDLFRADCESLDVAEEWQCSLIKNRAGFDMTIVLFSDRPTALASLVSLVKASSSGGRRVIKPHPADRITEETEKFLALFDSEGVVSKMA
nr:hypothetical protein HmN_000138000 [Hymenolepis microstoma]